MIWLALFLSLFTAIVVLLYVVMPNDFDADRDDLGATDYTGDPLPFLDDLEDEA